METNGRAKGGIMLSNPSPFPFAYSINMGYGIQYMHPDMHNKAFPHEGS